MKKENKCSRTFLVTSFQGGIGKTFVASELAKAIHDKTGKNVALIELNLLRPSSLVESLDKEMGNKLDLFDYYTYQFQDIYRLHLSCFLLICCNGQFLNCRDKP